GGKWTAADWYPDDKQIRASGSLKCSARDLSRWVRMQLGGGELDGKRILSRESLAQTHTPQIVVPRRPGEARLTEATLSSYALRGMVTDDGGEKVLEHGGAVDGFRARIVLLPRARVGVVLLCNAEETGVLAAAGHRLLDRLLGKPAQDWHAHYLARAK